MLQTNLDTTLVRTEGPATVLSDITVTGDKTFLELVKAHCRLSNTLADEADGEFTEEDTHLRLLTNAAYDRVEELTGLVLLDSEYALHLSQIPSGGCYGTIRLPVGPVTDVTVTYYDGDNVLQTWDSENYQLEPETVDWSADLQLISLNARFPNVHRYRTRPIIVNFSAGVGTTYSVLPDAATHAILMLAAWWYRDREGFSEKRLPSSSDMFWHSIDTLTKTFMV